LYCNGAPQQLKYPFFVILNNLFAVVTPGAILLGLLKNSGMPEVSIGAWRGAMAVSGALGTFLAPWLLKRKGIIASAKITIIGMQTAITSAAALYLLRNSFSQGLQLFLVPVTFSRMFLYAYDLVEVQVTPRCNNSQTVVFIASVSHVKY
jgi:hypothetical protein